MGTLVFGILVWEVWLGNFSSGAVAWELRPGIFRSCTFVWDLSLGQLGLRMLGEPVDGHWGNRGGHVRLRCL